ncbi:MAG: ATP-binding protein [Leptolyngbyaceae cyanobacterium]
MDVAAAALADSNNALIQLMDHSPDWIALFDQQHRYQWVSQGLAAFLSASQLPWLEQTNTDLAQQAHQTAYPKAWCKYWQQVADALTTVVQTGRAECRIHPLPAELAGDPQFCEVTYTPIKTNGEAISQIVSIGRVVSAEAIHDKAPKSLTKAQLVNYPDAIVGAEMPQQVASSGSDDAGLAIAPEPTSLYKAVNSPLSGSLVHQSAELMQLVLDNIPQYIFWKDYNSVYLGCNQRWAEMAGLSHPNQVVGLTDADLPWSEEEVEWYLQCDRRVMESDTPMLRIKESQLQADGHLTWRETSKLPIHDAQGNVVGILGTIEDITERKRGEDLLKESEETYRNLAKQEELLNQIFNQIRQSLSLDVIQQRTVHEVRQLFNADRVVIYRFGENWVGEVVTESVIAPWRPLIREESRDNCFPEDHGAKYLAGRIRTITDIETDEGLDDCHRDFLRSIQVRSNAIVPILIQEKVWGLLIAQQCSGPREWQTGEIELLKALSLQVSIAIQQAELYAQAMESAELAQRRANELQTMLQTLQQTQTQLVQTEKMSGLGQMVAGIAHEINNPVNFIYGNIPHITEYLDDLTDLLTLYRQHYPNPNPEIADRIEDIDLDYLLADLNKILHSFRLGSQRIQQIVASLRTFSRLDEVDKKATDLHEGIDSTLLILHHRFKAKPERPQIEVVKEYGDLPLVECYPGQLNQVFMNILSNGIDALEQEILSGDRAHKLFPAAITIKTQARPGEFIVRISDNGPGIPEKHRQKLFDPFFTTKPIGKGTGLGLSISHQIVTEKHGGQLSIASEAGKGAEFCIQIPR